VRLFRVFPWVQGARSRTPGHALHVPVVQGAGRVDNPEHYRVLYLSDAPEGAIAEAFGNLGTWSDAMFEVPSLPGARRGLGTYELPDGRLLDLDDARVLLDRELRPSHVVTRDRAVTHRWALRIFGEETWSGVRWWSYYDPAWGSCGVWDQTDLKVVGVAALDRSAPPVGAAASVIRRSWR